MQATQLHLEEGWRDSVGYPMQPRDQRLAAYAFITLYGIKHAVFLCA